MILNKITTKEAFYIAKALKVKYGIKITDSLKETNFNEFYESINKEVFCDSKTLEYLFYFVNRLDENISNLIITGQNIVLEEKYFKKLDWSQIISNLKTSFSATNRKLGKLIECNHKSIGEWERNTKTPNYNNCKLIIAFISKNKLDAKILSDLGGMKHTYKSKYNNIKYLALTTELAELIGILNGDGTISKSGLIAITGNHIEDFKHHEIRVKHLIKNLFSKDIYQKKVNGSIIKSAFTSLYISKQLKSIGLPIGKKNDIRIPQCILKDKILLRFYLRGLFDTDGTVCRRNKGNIRVGYGSFNSKEFTEDIFYAIKHLGFKSVIFIHGNRFRVEIISDFEVIRFFQEIGSCNYSKITRFIYWRINHICPSYSYTEFILRLKETDLDVEKLALPFLWNKKYIRSQDSSIQKILMPRLEEDEIKFSMFYLRKNINWKEKVKLLKGSFNLTVLTNEFGCNYKTIWQWQTGRNIPNINQCVSIMNFCKDNKIKLIY